MFESEFAAALTYRLGNQYNVEVTRQGDLLHILIYQKRHPVAQFIDNNRVMWDAAWSSADNETVVQMAKWVIDQDPIAIHANLDYYRVMDAIMSSPGRDYLSNHVVAEAAAVWVRELHNRVHIRYEPEVRVRTVEKVVFKDPPPALPWVEWTLSFVPNPDLTPRPVFILGEGVKKSGRRRARGAKRCGMK